MIVILHNPFSLGKLNVELHILHSLPGPTKTRKHLTLNEKGLLTFSGKRSGICYSNRLDKYLI